MKTGPRLGISTSAFFPMPLEVIFDILGQQNWRWIELMPQSPAECQPAFAETLLSLADGRFEFCGIHYPHILAPFLYNPYPSAFAFGQQVCADLANLAGSLGCTSIVIHAPWERMAKGSYLEATLANFRLLCDRCAGHDVLVALENVPSTPIANSPEALIAFAELVDRPNLSFTLDITHCYQMEQDPAIYFESLPHIAHVHASDFIRATEQQHTAPGTGDVDWPGLVGALRNQRFAGNFVLELLPETLGENPAQTLRQCTALLDPLFADWPEA